MCRPITLSVAVLLLATAAEAQDHAHGGAEKLGTVHFQTSCNEAAAPLFDRGVAWLHSFEFAGAIASFQQTLGADPGCAMAQWGIALSNWSNPMAIGNRAIAQLEKGQAAITAANRITGQRATPREKDYIAAVAKLYENFGAVNQATRVAAYEKAMASLASRYPEDTEAAIFHAISMVAAASPSDKSYASQKKAGALLETLWEKQPEHPGLAHYIIHAYDYPSLAPEASRAAQRYAEIAPSTTHALHMPSHTFTRIGLWRESIETNRKSRLSGERTGAIAEALHALDYTTYAYLQLQRYADAKQVLDDLPALAARFEPNSLTGAATGAAGVFALAAIPARYALEREAWTEAASLKPSRSSFEWADAVTWFARAVGAARSRNTASARQAVDSLAVLRDRLAKQGEAYWTEQVAIQHLAGQAWLDMAEGRPDSALSRIQQAVQREDATEKSAVTPGPIAPAREMLGDMLMELGRPAEALAEYRRTLLREPNRYRSIARGADAAKAANDSLAEREFRAKLEALRIGA